MTVRGVNTFDKSSKTGSKTGTIKRISPTPHMSLQKRVMKSVNINVQLNITKEEGEKMGAGFST